MTLSGTHDVADFPLAAVVEKVVARRLLWLFALPFIMTAILVVMFFVLNKRLSEVELGAKLVTIERYLSTDENYTSAIDQYEELAKSNPSAPILTRLGMLYFLLDKQKNKDVAIRWLEMAKRADPQYPEVYRSMAFIYLDAGQFKEAIEAGKKALELNPKDAGTYNNLAWLYATAKEPNTKDLQLALQYAQKAVALTNGKQANFLDTLAEVYFALGDRENALLNFRKAKAAILGNLESLEDHFKKLFPSETL
jgi:tetratricopeptide (TPR) repeat protein